MAGAGSDVELITSPRKVASIRRLSSLRTKTRRASLIAVKSPNVRRPHPIPTARLTLLRLPGVKQSLLTFAKKQKILDEARAALAKRKELPLVQPDSPDSSSSEDGNDSDDEETVTIPWEDDMPEEGANGKRGEITTTPLVERPVPDGYYNSDDEEDRDPARIIAECQATLSATLRVQRPIMTDYRLGAAVMYIPATAVQEGEVVGWYKPVDEAYVHPEVIALLDNNSLSHLRDKFALIGAYTHLDIVQLSLAIQGKDGWAVKSNLLNGLELKPQAVDWHCLLNVLSQYARPV